MSDPFHPLNRRDWTWQPAALTPDYKTTGLRSPQRPLVFFENTMSETTGPVFGHDLISDLDNNLVLNFASAGGEALGPRIALRGRVLDENGRGVPNALIEIWQANAAGRYRHKNDGYRAPLDPNFAGCGRTITDDSGHYVFHTVRPAPYPWPNGPNTWRPAHIHFSVFGHAFAQRLVTQMYFEGDPLIALCPIVNAVSDPGAVDHLVAKLDLEASTPMDAMAYHFDIVLRGRHATPFENHSRGV
ncbi:MAG: protocatechuate 3,4-dioxygenase subunit beta [Pseudomonadota bacterium]